MATKTQTKSLKKTKRNQSIKEIIEKNKSNKKY